DVMKQVYIQQSNIISPLGFTTDENFEAVRTGKTGIRKLKLNGIFDETFVSSIDEDQAEVLFARFGLRSESSRIEKLAIAALFPLIQDRKTLGNSLLIVSTTKGNVKALAENDTEAGGIPTLAKNIATYF